METGATRFINPEQSARALDIDDRIYQNAKLESKPTKYSRFLAPTSSTLFLTCLYDLLHKPCTEHSALSLVCSFGNAASLYLTAIIIA